MSFYQKLYNNLCLKGKLQECNYGPGSELHAHHIVPKHAGGLDEKDNITYLTIREHIAVHFLLWKINSTPNDLRAMHILGAHLTSAHRRIIGEFCRDNQLGFHGATKEDRDVWRRRAAAKAYAAQRGIHDPSMKPLYASLGGQASWNSPNNPEFKFWASAEGRKLRSQMGAAVSGKFPVTDGSITKKLKTEKDRQQFLDTNPLWRAGTHHINPNKGTPTGIPSRLRRPVRIEGLLFECVAHAADHHKVTSATVINRCRSIRWPEWNYEV